MSSSDGLKATSPAGVLMLFCAATSSQLISIKKLLSALRISVIDNLSMDFSLRFRANGLTSDLLLCEHFLEWRFEFFDYNFISLDYRQNSWRTLRWCIWLITPCILIVALCCNSLAVYVHQKSIVQVENLWYGEHWSSFVIIFIGMKIDFVCFDSFVKFSIVFLVQFPLFSLTVWCCAIFWKFNDNCELIFFFFLVEEQKLKFNYFLMKMVADLILTNVVLFGYFLTFYVEQASIVFI